MAIFSNGDEFLLNLITETWLTSNEETSRSAQNLKIQIHVITR